MANNAKKKITKDVKKVEKKVKKDVKDVKKDLKKGVKKMEKKVETKTVEAEKKVEQVEKKVEQKVEKVEKKIDKATTPRAKEYRRRARETVKPMKGDFAVTYFVYEIMVAAVLGIGGALLGFGAAASSIGSALMGAFTIFTSGAFEFSLINLAKQARNNKTKPSVGGIFFGFKERYSQSLAVNVMVTIFTLLWSLLLIIPGIIKSYAYAMSYYIALDNPGKSTLDCITESRKLMKGYKWRLFCLHISHIGWFILIVLTLGILSFWVMPKYRQANYEFYLHVSHKA